MIGPAGYEKARTLLDGAESCLTPGVRSVEAAQETRWLYPVFALGLTALGAENRRAIRIYLLPTWSFASGLRLSGRLRRSS